MQHFLLRFWMNVCKNVHYWHHCNNMVEKLSRKTGLTLLTLHHMLNKIEKII